MKQVRHRQILYDLIYMLNKKKLTKIKNRLINTENTLVDAIEEEGRGWAKGRKEIKRYKLPVVK